MFARFVWRNQLSCVLSKGTWNLGFPNNITYEDPPKQGRPYNAIINHMIYDRSTLEGLIPNAMYLSVVRHPYHMFLSYWRYFNLRNPYNQLQHPELDKKVETRKMNDADNENQVISFLEELSEGAIRDEIKAIFHKRRFFNQMSFDFGIKRNKTTAQAISSDDQKILEDWGKGIGNEFHHVLVVDHIDESIVLLKRIMNWELSDVVVLKTNVQTGRRISKTGGISDRVPHSKQKQAIEIHKKYNKVDWMLFNYWNKTLWRRIDEQPDGREGFMKEVEAYKDLKSLIELNCKSSGLIGDTVGFTVPKSNNNEAFVVDREWCFLMRLNPLHWTALLKSLWTQQLTLQKPIPNDPHPHPVQFYPEFLEYS
eukprot:CAMPEP_0174250030 /NCGR_PEP_ID=MMETSP0439-20130205/334_1 /TAXON_ID=0 /ORGANISM="Stereomyxa ramosa, Strain Chinc5" /LENGTH=366 /DNA_ID=CAMNT_0015329999 /DNA_START=230 /DNA_END=1330 /DNA_ORIENTATION=+